MDQSLYYMIGNSFLRLIWAHLEDPGAFKKLQDMRPMPSNYIVWGSTKKVRWKSLIISATIPHVIIS